MKFENDIKIILTNEILSQLIKCVDNASPNESCGLIFGEISQVSILGSEEFQYHYIGKKFTCIESNEKSPVAFLINDIEKLNSIILEGIHNNNLRLISIFHSHPSGARPSGIDTHNMEFLDDFGIKTFKNQIWTIMSARSKKLNGFIYFHKKLMQVYVKIENT